MEHLHFQDEETLKAQRISDEEARRVVALWAEKQKERDERSAQPTVQAMAEGLDIPPEEVLRLLNEVRAREAAVQTEQAAMQVKRTALSHHRRAKTQRWLWVSAAALVLFLFISLFSIRTTSYEVATPAAVPQVAPVVPNGNGEDAVYQPDGTTMISRPGVNYLKRADGSVVLDTPQGHYEYHADGSLIISGPSGNYRRGADGSLDISGPGGSYSRRADGSEEIHGTRPNIRPPTPPPGVTLPASP